jgi:hypothetical protein
LAYERIFKHYDSDFSSLGDLDSDLASHAEFTLLRQGGCGQATMTLAESFDTSTLEVGQHIQFCYDSTPTAWYLGRIEEIDEKSPSGKTVRLMGWLSYLNDLPLGGRGRADAEDPILYADDEDRFPSDPDKEDQVWVNATDLESVATDIYDNVIDPSTPVGLSAIDTPTEDDALHSMVFRGEENVSQVLRMLAVSCGWMSWGVQEDGLFFLKNLPAVSTHEFQIGVNVKNLSKKTDRSMMYNRMHLTGGPIYGTGTEHGHYNYKRNIAHWPSIASYGEKIVRLHIPWIRTDNEAQRFAEQFFSEYASLSTSYSFEVPTSSSGDLPKPWVSRVLLKDYDGTELKNAVPIEVNVTFDATIVIRMTLGPEELQFPTDNNPDRDPDFSPTDLGDASPFNCDGLDEPLAPPGGWSLTGECESNGGWVFGTTTAEISAESSIEGPVTVTPCRELEYDETSDTLNYNGNTFDMRSFDPDLDGTEAGVPVICRKIKNKYWKVWVGCTGGTSSSSASG